MSQNHKSTFLAKTGVDLSAKAGYLVRENTGLDLSTDPLVSAGQKALGVIDQGGGNTAGLACTVIRSGRALVRAGAAIAAGARFTTTAAGKATTAAAGDIVYGVANEAAGADLDLFEAEIGIYNWTLDTDT